MYLNDECDNKSNCVSVRTRKNYKKMYEGSYITENDKSGIKEEQFYLTEIIFQH